MVYTCQDYGNAVVHVIAYKQPVSIFLDKEIMNVARLADCRVQPIRAFAMLATENAAR